MLKNMENKIYHILVLNLGTTSFKYKLFEVTNKSEKEIANWEIEHKAMLLQYPEKFTIPHYAAILDLKNLE